ncbi:unnamed protein product [Clavelina lepadiformis]|uniref:Fibrinogen C-terminal domain-containing protein n=1 Tax=Clavelina lepadiformis TaxID=159417 RepID=A0ABP0GNB0_CLALP
MAEAGTYIDVQYPGNRAQAKKSNKISRIIDGALLLSLAIIINALLSALLGKRGVIHNSKHTGVVINHDLVELNHFLIFFRQKYGELHVAKGIVGINWESLEKIHNLTGNGGCRLKIHLWDFAGGYRYVEFHTSSVANESEKFCLLVDGYAGTAGDSLAPSQNHRPFFTPGRVVVDGGSKPGFEPALNAVWSSSGGYATGIIWFTWRGNYESLKATSMKLMCD